MTPEQLAEIEARLRQITPIPWEECWVSNGPNDPGVSAIMAFRNDVEFVVVRADGEDGQAPQESMDIEFIAHAPTDISALLAEVRRLRGDMYHYMKLASKYVQKLEEAGVPVEVDEILRKNLGSANVRRMASALARWLEQQDKPHD